ncbi:hypothetical protein OAE49_06320 [Gammaproteobacteria bacterium]|nr:hypothetical protein [Gammaproteobacteria bacterium]
MANQDAAFGLRLSRSGNGSDLIGMQNKYRIAANYGTSIFQGDIVKAVTGGGVERIAAGNTDFVLGVFNGCRYTDPTTGKETFSNFYPASTNAADIEAFIIDAPHAQYEIQADAAFPVADLFGNFDIVDATAGSTASGTSRTEIDVTTGATTAGLPLKAIDISTDPENSDVGSANTNVIVVINNHLFSAGTTGLA